MVMCLVDSQVLGFTHRLANMPRDSLSADILMDNIQDAEHSPQVTNSAGGVWKQFINIVMASPISGDVVGTVDVLVFQKAFPEIVCLAGPAHVAANGALSSCQAMHLFLLVGSA